jgi:uncharacterized protein (DUF2235 family)
MAKNIVILSDGTGQDGGVRPEQRISNVYKMYRASRVHPDNAIDPEEQVVFYDPGLGTDIGASGLLSILRKIDKLMQSVTGRGITRNMADCYEFIINHYEPGDRIYLIGFSRGAYTVRALANTIMLCGVPTRVGDRPLLRFRKQVKDIAREAVETVYEHGAGHPRGKYEAERDEQARRFREKYGSDFVGQDEDKTRSNAAAYFVGVYDTVAALGATGFRRFLISAGLTTLFAIPAAAICYGLAATISHFAYRYGYAVDYLGSTWKVSGAFVLSAICWFLYRQRAQYTKTIHDYPTHGESRSHQAEWRSANFDRLLSKYVLAARSANAIDERRKDFDRVAWGQKESTNLRQRWFAGNHSDVGGSYPEAESRLSDISLQWMLEKILELENPIKFGPVLVNGKQLNQTGTQGTPLFLYPDVTAMQHSEIAGTRDTIDALRERLPKPFRWLFANANYEIIKRSILPNAKIHSTVMDRFKLDTVIDPANDTIGNYRPEALRKHEDFKDFYPPETPANTPPSGKNEEVAPQLASSSASGAQSA